MWIFVFMPAFRFMRVQVGFGFYPVVVKYFANNGDSKVNAYVFTFYR